MNKCSILIEVIYCQCMFELYGRCCICQRILHCFLSRILAHSWYLPHSTGYIPPSWAVSPALFGAGTEFSHCLHNMVAWLFILCIRLWAPWGQGPASLYLCLDAHRVLGTSLVLAHVAERLSACLMIKTQHIPLCSLLLAKINVLICWKFCW